MATQTIYTNKDAHTSSRDPTLPFGGASQIEISHTSTTTRHGYIGFDISSAPVADTVSAVLLYIHNKYNDSHDDPMGTIFSRVTSSWTEAGITWNDPPTITTTNQVARTIPSGDAWYSYDVTQLYKDAKNAGNDFSTRIHRTSGDAFRSLKSRETASAPYIVITYEEVSQVPVITSISWSPKGSFSRVSTGASLVGQYGSEFRVVAVGPSTTPPLATEEIMAELAGAAAAVYRRGDTFMLDSEGFTILHAIDDGECSHAVVAKNVSTNQHPTVGEEINFSASINWNDDGATATTRRMEWLYLKPPSESYTKAYADDINNWTHFATDILPTHTFTAIDDADIIYLKVIARNKADQTTEFGVGTCSAGLFNLWGGADGFEITVTDGTGADDLHIAGATLVPGTNAYLIDPYILRWDDVVNQVYFGTRDAIGCVYSDPQPDMCGSYAMVVGSKYAIYRSTSFMSVVPGDVVFELKSGRTAVTADRSYLNFLESSICQVFGLSGSECTSFVAELSDVVFVANYASILATGKDTFGNDRELTWFDHVALPFALLGSVVPIPCGQVIRKGGYAVAKISEKVFSVAAARWAVMSVFDAPSGSLHAFDEKLGFSRAIVYVGQSTAEEIVNLLDVDDMDTAYQMLQNALNKIDPDDVTTFNAGFDWHEFNSIMKAKFDDPNLYGEYLRQSDLISGWADQIKTVASKATPTSAEKTAIANAVNEPAIMKVVGEDTTAALRTLNQVTDPVAKANKVNAIENVAKNMPAAFDDVAKASIHDVSGYVIKHDVIENVLGKSTCSANYELTTRLFKRLFDGVDEVALASTECDGIMAIAKEDPVAIAKAFDDYTDLVDKERLMLSLGKSGTKGEDAAAWLAAAKKNFDMSAVHQRFGMTVYDVVNDASQVPMHGPNGVYRTAAIEAIDDAINSVPNFATLEDFNSFIRETSETVRAHAIANHLDEIVQKAKANDTRLISDIFRSVGVDIIPSDLMAGSIASVTNWIDVLESVVDGNDVSTIVARSIEADIVSESKAIEKVIRRIVADGTISNNSLKALFDVQNHVPDAYARAITRLPADVCGSFNGVLDSSKKGGLFKKMADSFGEFKTKLNSEYGTVISDSVSKFYAETAPVGMRFGRDAGGAGFHQAFNLAGTLKSALFKKSVKAYLVYAFGTTVGGLIIFWFAFEWGPFRYMLQENDKLPESVGSWYDDVKTESTFGAAGFEKNPNMALNQEIMIDVAGQLCELVDYGIENPVVSGAWWSQLQDDANLYFATSQGLTPQTLQQSIVSTLEAHLKTYNEYITKCIADGLCTDGTPKCIISAMVWSKRQGKTHALANAAAYQTIIDDTWVCTESGVGSIKYTSNQSGFAVYLDGDFKDHSWGKTWYILTNVPIGSHTAKIFMGENYLPPECEGMVTVVEGEEVPYDCQMTKIGECSPVTSIIISITPKNPVKDEPVSFTGYATSEDPIETWEWDFGDGSAKEYGQTTTHTYTRAEICTIKLTVANDCGESDSAERAVTITETPIEEAGTLLVKEPIDAITGAKCKGSWTAEIYVDGNTIGKTTQFSIPFGTDEYIGGYGGQCGTHTITIFLSGYDYVSKSVTIDDGDTKSWQPEMYLEGTNPDKGSILCETDPQGAAIWIVGSYRGDTNKTIADLPTGATVVTFKKTGYADCVKTVTVVKDGTVTASCTLVADVAEHTVNVVVPAGATLYVDGNFIGTTTIGRLSTILRGLRK